MNVIPAETGVVTAFGMVSNHIPKYTLVVNTPMADFFIWLLFNMRVNYATAFSKKSVRGRSFKYVSSTKSVNPSLITIFWVKLI